MASKINWIKGVGVGAIILGTVLLIVGGVSTSGITSLVGAVAVVVTAVIAIFASDIKKVADNIKAKTGKVASDVERDIKG